MKSRLILFNAKKIIKFKQVLWVSSCRISIAQGNYLLVLVNDSWRMSCLDPWPLGLKSYLLSKKIYLSWMIRQNFFRAKSCLTIAGQGNSDFNEQNSTLCQQS